MPSIFDEASKATEEMFEEDANPAVLDEEIPEDTSAEVPEDTSGSEELPTDAEEVDGEPGLPENPTPEEMALSEATETAETAARVAQEKEMELQQMRQQLDAIRQQNAQLAGTVEELSRRNEEQIVEEALLPPELDISGLAFADEETVKAAQAKYAQDMAEYSRQGFMKEFAPVIEMANKQKYAEEKNAVLSALSQVPELSGLEAMIPQLDKIIANNKALSSDNMSMDEKYITAYAIAKGVNAINTPPVEPKDPTAEELMAFYNSNPEFQEMIERQRLEQVKQSQQVPPFSASSGAVNAALDIPEEPKGWADASERTRKMFGL
jgi:hypothetical protein